MNTPAYRVRWWPAVLILALVLIAIAWLWLGADQVRQFKVMRTAGALTLGSVLLLVWLTFFSRTHVRTRLLAWGVLLASVGLFSVTFRYRGVTGDFLPVFQPRWQGEVEIRASGEPIESSTHDYSQFLGPDRNGTVKGVRLARDWSARPPRLVWRRPVGKAWSSFAVVGDVAVTQEQHGEEERIISYDLKTAEIRWSHGDAAGYSSPVAGDGPRATPTVVGGRVYTLGATGLLNALDLESGKRLWTRDILADNDATNAGWGKSCSPLVVDGLVVVSAGGSNGKSLVAYDAITGDIAWQGGEDRSAYSSPLLTTLAGRRQIVILNENSVVAHDPTDGRVLWSHPWPAGMPSVSQPLPLSGDRLLVSAGYGMGSKLFEIRADASGELRVSLRWETPRLKAKFANLVYHNGFVYGLDDGILVCLDPETGDLRWKRGRYGHGQLILVEDLLLVQTEKGEIVLVDPSPEGLKELTRFRVMNGKTWNSPALAGPYLLVRTEQEAALFELPVEGEV